MAHWGREKSNLIAVLQRVHILIKCQTLAEQTGDVSNGETLTLLSVL